MTTYTTIQTQKKDFETILNEFKDFLSTINDSNITRFRDNLYKKIREIAKIIDSSPNRELLKKYFYDAFSDFDASPIHRRAREKPLGYAGDYLLIDWIYTEKKSRNGISRFLDELFHSYEAAEAVRNRKQFFINKCHKMIRESCSTIHILNIGCGSCRDILETITTCKNRQSAFFHCIDQEQEAIEYARNLLKDNVPMNNIKLECANCFRFRSNQKYDLIWSAGMFDYFEDRLVIILLRKLWRYLKDGGEIVFGNFSPKNPTKIGMELGCNWYLIHRSSNDLIRLCKKANIPFSEIEIESEPLGINLFCTIKK